MERSNLFIPAGSWENMEKMVEELFPVSPDDTATVTLAKVVKILREKVEKVLEKVLEPSLGNGQGDGQGDHDGKFGMLLKHFRDLIINETDQSVKFSGGLHCETVLATIGKYFETSLIGGGDSDDNANLTSICKVILLLTCRLILSEHLSLDTTSIGLDICVEIMLSSVLGPIAHIERRRARSIIFWPPFHRLSC